MKTRHNLLLIALLLLVSVASAQNNVYQSYRSYEVTSKHNPVADILHCRNSMYIHLGYDMAQIYEANYKTFQDVKLHGGLFDFGGIVRLWGPLGLDFGFGFNACGSDKIQPFRTDVMTWDGYEKTYRFKIDYRVNLMLVFWANVTDDIAVHLATGPRFYINFSDYERSYINGESDFGTDYEYFDITGNKKNNRNRYRCIGTAWSVGIGFNYKHIGVRVSYEMELYGRYRDSWTERVGDYEFPFFYDRLASGDPRFHHLNVSLFIPLVLSR